MQSDGNYAILSWKRTSRKSHWIVVFFWVSSDPNPEVSTHCTILPFKRWWNRVFPETNVLDEISGMEREGERDIYIYIYTRVYTLFITLSVPDVMSPINHQFVQWLEKEETPMLLRVWQWHGSYSHETFMRVPDKVVHVSAGSSVHVQSRGRLYTSSQGRRVLHSFTILALNLLLVEGLKDTWCLSQEKF